MVQLLLRLRREQLRVNSTKRKQENHLPTRPQLCSRLQMFWRQLVSLSIFPLFHLSLLSCFPSNYHQVSFLGCVSVRFLNLVFLKFFQQSLQTFIFSEPSYFIPTGCSSYLFDFLSRRESFDEKGTDILIVRFFTFAHVKKAFSSWKKKRRRDSSSSFQFRWKIRSFLNVRDASRKCNTFHCRHRGNEVVCHRTLQKRD